MSLWNKANNEFNIKSLEQNFIPFEKEILTQSQHLNEYIMTSLRTMEGMDLQFIEENFSLNERNRIERLVKSEVEKELFFMDENKMILTDKGKLFADRISVELFL
jgi:oxygen-independent coproporphyrinogen-3 oxidase